MSGRGKHSEARFEDAIEIALCERGYERREPEAYAAKTGLFPADVVAYVKASQPRKWQSLADLQGDAAEGVLLDALVKELATKGSLHVLRHGFKCFGKTFGMAAFKPASGMNPDTIAAYAQNILTIARQVRFNPNTEQSVDVVLAVNGIPVATLELKSEFKQSVENAKRQYRVDRPVKDPLTRKPEPLLSFKRGALVHFAVSQDEVAMTTNLPAKGLSLDVECETRDRAHLDRLLAALDTAGYKVSLIELA